MTAISNFVRSVQERTALNQLIENGELGKCEECGEYTEKKDTDGEWWCGCNADWDDNDYNNQGRI
jgi:hypothetical protein